MSLLATHVHACLHKAKNLYDCKAKKNCVQNLYHEVVVAMNVNPFFVCPTPEP
jgi:hypothetical protein